MSRFKMNKTTGINDISLFEMKKRLLNRSVTEPMLSALRTIGANHKRPLGKFNPWAWWIEPVRGCNLKCNFCPTRLFPPKEIKFMCMDTWMSLLKVMQQVTPYCRLELCNAGEPTLHPQFLDLLRTARKMVPHVQLLVYTNGTQITNGRYSYKQLFDAGLNMVYLDMYAPIEIHQRLAEKSGYLWFHQDYKPRVEVAKWDAVIPQAVKRAPSIFTHYDDPNKHIIMLANNPDKWHKRKLARGYLQTFLNDLDWKAASSYGLQPVTNSPNRRCDMPSKFINVNHDGTFIFCCFDYMRHTVEKFGNINNGIEDFLKFWLGRYMQETRRKVGAKDRKAHEWCSKCRFTSIRCDVPYWRAGTEQYWNGKKWNKVVVKTNPALQQQISLQQPASKDKIQAPLFSIGLPASQRCTQ